MGPKGHTCTEAADRTAHAKHSRASQPALPDIASATLPVPELPPCRTGEAGRQNQGVRGELFLTLQTSEKRTAPFAQDTLYGLQNLHDGGCV